jgi:antitoxin PrlF
MDESARDTSKGQIVAKTPDFLKLAGSVVVPAAKRGTPWDEILKRTRADRAKTRR